MKWTIDRPASNDPPIRLNFVMCRLISGKVTTLALHEHGRPAIDLASKFASGVNPPSTEVLLGTVLRSRWKTVLAIRESSGKSSV